MNRLLDEPLPTPSLRELEELLFRLHREIDLRVLAFATALLARETLAWTRRIDPFNQTIIEKLEAWARGEIPRQTLGAVMWRAGKTKGAMYVMGAIELTVSQPSKLLVRQLAAAIPQRLWLGTEAGQRWASTGDNVNRKMVSDPKVAAEIDRIAARLVRQIEYVVGDGSFDVALERHRKLVATMM
jgi:hypothetical protein